jgi:hypothetical protein
MPSIHATVKPTPVPRCPKPGHGKHVRGCTTCRQRSVYLRALAIWENANGVDHSSVDTAEVREHLVRLTTAGHRTVPDISAESGVSDTTVRKILRGHRARLYPITEKSLLAVQPWNAPRFEPHSSSQVPAVEGLRILRGIFAQGWAWPTIGDLLGGLTGGAAQKIASKQRPWMNQDTLDRIRAVARLLGPYDIDHLARPMPGMDRRSANRAVKHGWHKLSAWHNIDITDPGVDPDHPHGRLPVEDDDWVDDFAVALLDDALAELPDFDEANLAFVDQLIVKKITETSERIKLESPAEDGRAGDLYIPKLELRWLELHAAWWYAEAAGLNDTQIGALLGYDMTDQASSGFDAGQRQVNRIRARMVEANALLDKDPTEWLPTWFDEHPKPVGKPNFGALLPALLAIQPEPLGRGWTAAQLADAIDAPERTVLDFLVYASREGERPWHRRTGPPLRVRHRPARCATTARAAA